MESRFQEYIDYVCGGIRSKRTRADVSDELLSHLEARYEQNRAVGQDEIIAQSLAIEQMGNREKLRQKFAALYRFYTPDYLRTALNCLLFGLIFIFTRLNLFPYADSILPFVGQMLILYALYRLHSINKPIKIAARIYLVYLLADNLHLFLLLYFAPDRLCVYITGVIAVLLFTASYTALFWGLDRACDTNFAYGDKPTLLILCALALWWASFLLCVFAINGEPLTAEDWGYFHTETILPLCITYFGFRRVKRILCHSEPEFSLQNLPTKRGKRIFAALLCVFLLLPFAAMCGAALRTPTIEPYIVSDTEETAETIAAARQHLLDLGLPASVLNDLPDSEVLRYRSAQHMEVDEPYIHDKEIPCKIYIFFTTEQWASDGETLSEAVRVLYAFDGFDAQKVHLRDGFCFQLCPKDFYGFSPDKLSPFGLILGEKNDATYCAQPFRTYPETDTGTYATAIFEFTFPKGSKNRRAYFANSGIIRSTAFSKISYVSGEYYHRVLPLYFEYRNHEERAISRLQNRVFYADTHLSEVDVQQYDANIDYQPAFYGIKGEWRFVEDDTE